MSDSNEQHAWNKGFYGVPNDKPYDTTQAEHTARQIGAMERERFKMMEREILGEKPKNT